MSWLLSAYGLPIHAVTDIADALDTVSDTSHTVEWIFAPGRSRKQFPTQDNPPHLNIDQLASIARTLAHVHQKLDMPLNTEFDPFLGIDPNQDDLTSSPLDFINYKS